VEAMLLDVDGDGLLDRVLNSSKAGTSGTCSATWQRNNGPDASGQLLMFSAPPPGMTEEIPLPRLKWRGSVSPHPAGGATAADTNVLRTTYVTA
jgi:hypothetical protein